MKSNTKKIFVLSGLALTSILFHTVSYSFDDTITLPEKSEAFASWEKLSEEERKNTLIPSYSSIIFRDSVKRSTYNDLFAKRLGENLEASYRVPKEKLTVKNQEKTSLCWAFSFSSILQGSGSGKVYSPAYLEYASEKLFNKSSSADGGNYFVAMGTATSGNYPVVESKLPFSSIYNETTNSVLREYLTPLSSLPADTLTKAVDARITNTTSFASLYKSIASDGTVTYHSGSSNSSNTYSSDDVTAMRKLIKEHIKNNGPLTAMTYSDLKLDSNGNINSTDYYNADTGAYFYNGKKSGVDVNHAITIVGWDDDYETSNFNADAKPTNPGAYIVLNSYGNKVGKDRDGYMYISYDDVYIESGLMGINSLDEYDSESEITYDKIYQHDELGMDYQIILNSESNYIANVFSRDVSKNEEITEVGLFLPATEGVEVYINAANDNKDDLTLVATETTNISTGYHVIKLTSPVKLTGEKFVVAAKLTNKGDGVQIPLEANLKESNISTTNYYDTAESSEGESFFKYQDRWIDLWNCRISNESGNNTTLKNTNICLKAYVNELPYVAVTGVTLDKSSTTMKVEENVTLVPTVNPTDATNKNVSWKSSDESIAKVENGKVTAIKEGTVTITVTTEDGAKTATCEITVNPKTDNQTTDPETGDQGTDPETGDQTTDPETGNQTTDPETGDPTTDPKTDPEENPTPSKVPAEGVKLNLSNLSLEVGDKGNLVATITPVDATNKNVIWTSSDTSVATISKEGVITALKEGTTIITVTTEDGSYTASCVLTVKLKTNTADDIYKDGLDNKPGQQTNDASINGEIPNNTTASGMLPNAGKASLAIVSIISLITSIALYLINRRFRNIE